MKVLRDRVAVVTGAASGIGRATSIALAKQGCRLAISDVNEAELERTSALVRACSVPVYTQVVDVADRQAMSRYANSVAQEYGSVNIVVNNAGVSVAGTFEEQTLEDFAWLVGVNFWGVVYGCKFFLPHLKVAEEAHIVNISSVFGFVGVPKQSSYCASKFAVRGFTESLQLELQDDGIGVTTVHPGSIDTNIARGSRGKQELLVAAGEILSKGISADRAAERIVEAIKGNKPRQLITREAYLLDWMKRAAPKSTQWVIGKTAKSFQRRFVR